MKACFFSNLTFITLSLPPLSPQFDISRVHTSSCRLDPERLRRLNLLALRRRYGSPTRRPEMWEEVRRLVRDRFAER